MGAHFECVWYNSASLLEKLFLASNEAAPLVELKLLKKC
jgi:hypothetical protein